MGVQSAYASSKAEIWERQMILAIGCIMIPSILRNLGLIVLGNTGSIAGVS
jgi:hypothetical protein